MASSSLDGRVIEDRYRIDHKIGGGGMGEVFRARQLNVDRDVALKLLRPERAHDERAVAQFLTETTAVSRLTSPHTVTLYDAGRLDDGAPYIAMELLEGRTLRARLEAGAMAREEKLRVLDAIALSLAEAHARGIVHRDLKPSNVFLAHTPGHAAQVKVLDFGLARLVERDETDGRAAGTLLYMAPETLRGETVDARADVYALGMIAHELFAGSHPFAGKDRRALLDAQLEEVPPALDDEDVPADAAALVARSLAKQKRLRPRDAGVFRKALREAFALPTDAEEAKPIATVGSHDETIASQTVVSRTMPQAPDVAPRQRLPQVWVALGALLVGGGIYAVARGPAAGPTEVVASAAPTSSDGPTDDQQVELAIESTPAGAAIVVDGTSRGHTPATLRLPRGDEPHRLELQADGHAIHRQTIWATRNTTVVVTLSALPPEAPLEEPGGDTLPADASPRADAPPRALPTSKSEPTTATPPPSPASAAASTPPSGPPPSGPPPSGPADEPSTKKPPKKDDFDTRVNDYLDDNNDRVDDYLE